MLDLLLIFLSISFGVTLGLGILLEKMRIPWIFGALILGMILAWKNPFAMVTNAQTFQWLGQIGMYFLLFIIGFEIDVKEWLKQGKFITKLTITIIPFEAIFGSMFFHFAFGVNWVVSSIAALSFATVGEAMLVPILDEFNLVNKKMGQTIIGVGTLDDIFEVLTLILVSFLYIGNGKMDLLNSAYGLIGISILFGGLIFLRKMSEKKKILKVPKMGAILIFIISIMFLFAGVGSIGDSAALGALFAGIGVKNFIPKKRLKFIEKEIKGISYGFFAPIFFLWVGISTDMNYIISSAILLVLAGIAISYSAKILGTWIMAHKEMGNRQALMTGVALGVRFSTSIVVAKILLDHSVIPLTMYSVIVATTVLFKFIVPGLLSYMISKWKNYIT